MNLIFVYVVEEKKGLNFLGIQKFSYACHLPVNQGAQNQSLYHVLFTGIFM